ncbi:MAG: right-handed parallel beta-helix repeat-containing protein [Planctomycetota bacterium]|nr:right-handed parallel beta-helix repeat-containing protein [Planctomycetota bacterium]MDP7252578.1 right-handed parallel beta-helix repeat-containing protein [Planctomycetota bacterium]
MSSKNALVCAERAPSVKRGRQPSSPARRFSAALLWIASLGTGRPPCATEIMVKPGESITDAVAAAKAGDTVRVRRGIYYENVVIKAQGTEDSPIVIEGEPGAIIDGRAKDISFEWQPAPDIGRGVYRAIISKNILLLSADGKYLNPLNPTLTSKPGSWNYREVLKNGLPRTRRYFGNKGLLFFGSVYTCRRMKDRRFELLVHFYGDTPPDALSFAACENLSGGRHPVGKAVVNVSGARHVAVRGFIIRNGWYAILMEGGMDKETSKSAKFCEGIRIEYNTITATQKGIFASGPSVRNCRIYKNDVSLPAFNRWNLPSAFGAKYKAKRSALEGKALEDLFELHKSLGYSDPYSIFCYQTGPRVDIGYNYVHNHWQGPQDQSRDMPGTCHRIMFHHNRCDDFMDGGFEIGGDGNHCHVFNNTITNAGWGIRWKWPKGDGPLFVHHNLFGGENDQDFVLFRKSNALTYFYHNTCAGGKVALVAGKEWGGPNVYYRNNLFLAHYNRYHNPKSGAPPMAPDHVDYNIFNADKDGQLKVLKYEAHGILAPGLKVRPDFSLPLDSRAIDGGAELSTHFGPPLPGCPAGYFIGKAPDMGAIESGIGPPRFGVDPKACGAMARRKPIEPLFQDADKMLLEGIEFARKVEDVRKGRLHRSSDD